jgi:hypothetical protein
MDMAVVPEDYMQILKQEKYQSCIEACFSCAESCEACATACLRESDVSRLARCIQLDRDCADICAVAGRYMSRDSEYAKNMCRVCADVCDACAAECDKHKSMEHCRICAESCRACASECRRMMA